MFALVVPPVGTALSVASTNDPLGSGLVSCRTAVVTPLSRAALQSGMLSDVTGFVAWAETLRTDQSAPAVLVASVSLQTGSLNVTVASEPETVKLTKVGRLVSA